MGFELQVNQRRGLWVVQLRDSEHPGVLVVFSYGEVSGGAETAALGLVSYEVKDDPTTTAQFLAPDTAFRLPLRRWERAAKLAAYREKDRRAGSPRKPEPQVRRSDQVEARQRLKAVAEEYRQNILDGIRDPAGAIARRHQVAPATARAWIYRARKQGLLGPARSRTAGEEGEGT